MMKKEEVQVLLFDRKAPTGKANLKKKKKLSLIFFFFLIYSRE